jgi:putative ABC transport system permease protein
VSPSPAPRWARLFLRILAPFVPGHRRAEWLEEWEGELDALADLRGEGRGEDYPGWVSFVAGALPHAVWTRTEEWSMDGVLQDLRYAVRMFRRAPGFTAVAALTLALGIGANASIFSLVNGLILRPPAGIRRPELLVQIARSYDQAPRWDNWSWPALKLIEREARTLSGVAGYQTQAFVLGRGADTEQVSGQLVSGAYFDVLGIRPFLGRLLQPSDDVTPGGHPVVVLSHGLWVRRFGGDPGIVGRTIPVGARPYEVVGVAPPEFTGPEAVGTPPAVWVPAMQSPGYRGELPFDQWGWSWINAVGRLRDGVSFEEARASMDVVTARLREAAPVNGDIRVLVAPGVGLDPQGRAQAGRISLLLVGIVGLVLLLTCTNVANLFLARGAARTTEVGVRMAIGAGRSRVARQLVTESLVLALFATALAVPLVRAAGRFLPLIFPYTLSVSVGADGRVYLFLAAIGLAAGILFGVAPAWAATSSDLSDALREGRSGAGRVRTRLRDALVVTQLALSLGLVAAAALLGRSVVNARAAAPGFDPDGLVVAFIDLQPTGRYDPASGRNLFERVLARVATVPGVRNVTIASQAPIQGGHSRSTVQPADRPGDLAFEAENNVVGPRYFETLGIPLLQGRTLGGLEDEPERVVVINEALAQMFWPDLSPSGSGGRSAVGRRLAGDPGWRVVGVVGNVKMRSLRSEPMPGVYYPLSQAYSSRMVLHVRTDGSSSDMASRLRQAVAEVDPELPVANVVDLRQALATSMGETRTIGWLVATFALLALVLAAIGLYGLVAFGVSQRVRELGVRIALGARPESLVRMVLARGLILAGIGVVVGLGLSAALGRALEGLLFGIGAIDGLTLVGASVTLLATAVVAAWIPARRAARVDAAVSLRDE